MQINQLVYMNSTINKKKGSWKLFFVQSFLCTDLTSLNIKFHQKSPKHPGGGGGMGGQENCGLFPLFGTFFYLEATLRHL